MSTTSDFQRGQRYHHRLGSEARDKYAKAKEEAKKYEEELAVTPHDDENHETLVATLDFYKGFLSCFS